MEKNSIRLLADATFMVMSEHGILEVLCKQGHLLEYELIKGGRCVHIWDDNYDYYNWLMAESENVLWEYSDFYAT